MPYRLRGKTVQKQTPSGNWVDLKTHKSRDQALAHFRALQINVEEAHRPERKRYPKGKARKRANP